MAKARLSPTMSVSAFNNGYWGIDQLKRFGKELDVARASSFF